jgi:hypothetical protein
LATDPAKRELFTRLAEHLSTLAREVEAAIVAQLDDGSEPQLASSAIYQLHHCQDSGRTAGHVFFVMGSRARGAARYWRVRRNIGVRQFQHRAVMSMARLWRDQRKRREAHELLAPVYGWCTGGFDSLDLKQAKALLDELAVGAD